MSGLSDLELSDEILSIIPTDPFEQLDLAKKITSIAIASKVYSLEDEVVELMEKLQEMEMCTHELESEACRYERDLRQVDSRLKIVLHDNMNLTKERDSLATTVTNLNREMAKLETFKRQLVQSLSNDDETSPPQTEFVDIRTYDKSVPLSCPDKDQRTNVYTSTYAARTPRIDGKEFFRQVKSRLSYEQFRAFLANIRELNAQKQTQEETLRKADEIFGTENKDLYLSLQRLLNKNKN